MIFQSSKPAWPPKVLSPNSRNQHRFSGEERKKYKEACWAATKAAKFRASSLDITFHPPTGHRRDLDNLLASIKYGLDGVACAMGVDDSVFTEITIRKGEVVKPHGLVVVRDAEPFNVGKLELRGSVT